MQTYFSIIHGEAGAVPALTTECEKKKNFKKPLQWEHCYYQRLRLDTWKMETIKKPPTCLCSGKRLPTKKCSCPGKTHWLSHKTTQWLLIYLWQSQTQTLPFLPKAVDQLKHKPFTFQFFCPLNEKLRLELYDPLKLAVQRNTHCLADWDFPGLQNNPKDDRSL